MPLVATKFYVPSTRPELVPRRRLMAPLDLGLKRKLTLITAPAGFGKTVLVVEWLRHLKGASIPSSTPWSPSPRYKLSRPNAGQISLAWLSLDQHDNDPVLFFTYLITALERALPDLGTNVLPLLQAPKPPPLKTVLTVLINQLGFALAQSERNVVLVLDDYHLINHPEIHEGLTILLDYLPPQLHFVIASRTTPPLPLARWRAGNELVEVTTPALRFTPAEAATFLTERMELKLAPESVERLAAKTEGWIAGLQLAALTMHKWPEAQLAKFITEFGGKSYHVFDYLAEEVMLQQSARVQLFLCQTSILDRLTASLCDAVTNEQDSGRMLIELEQANLFLMPLDDQRKWYRYHHLFADFLQTRLQQEWSDQIPELHRRASRWYAEQATKQNDDIFVSKAIQHSLLARDYEQAAFLIEQIVESMLLRSEVATFLSWANSLPDEVIRARPQLAVFKSGMQLLEGASPAVVKAELDAITAVNSSATVVGTADSFRALIAVYQGNHQESVRLAQRALALLPPDSLFLRSFIPGFLGLNFLYHGDLANARSMFNEAVSAGHQAGNRMITVLATGHLAEIAFLKAQPTEARDLYRQAQARALDHQGHSSPIAGIAIIGLGTIYLEWFELAEAEKFLTQGIELIRQWAEVGGIAGYLNLAQLKQIQGRFVEAQNAIYKAQELAKKFDAMDIDDVLVENYQVRLWLARGELDLASNWVKTRNLSAQVTVSTLASPAATSTSSLLFVFENITLARVLLAQDQPQPALQVLNVLQQASEQAGWTSFVIDILILQSLAHQQLGEPLHALVALEQALALAEPGGFVRVFVEKGSPLYTLLKQAASRKIWPDYVNRLLKAFEESGRHTDAQELSETDSQIPRLQNPLSKRELEVLRFIAVGLSNQEIANELVVAVSTVKSHVNKIFRKLEVSSRTQAVARARELKLL